MSQTLPSDLLPQQDHSVQSLLDKYLSRFSHDAPTILSRFNDSLIGVSVNTRKAYNTDIWTALSIKFFHAWDLPREFDPIAHELLRLEVLRNLRSELTPDITLAINQLHHAVTTLSAIQQAKPASSKPEETTNISLRGSYLSKSNREYLSKVCINSTDKEIINHILVHYENLLNTNFWNHLFNPSSLGRIFRELEASGNSATTLARKMSSLQRFEQYLFNSKLLTAPILHTQRRPKSASPAQVVLRGDELNQIALYLDQEVATKPPATIGNLLLIRDRAMFGILDQYLIRASALCNLTTADIDLKRLTMRVVEKGRKQNVFPLKGYALRCLTDYLEIRAQLLARVGSSHSNREAIFYTVSGKTMNPRSLSRIIDTRAKQAGIKVNIGGRDTIGAHVIRRSGSTRYLQAGAPIESLAQLMNHSDISTTWRYVKGANLDLPKTILDKLGRE